MTGRVRGFTLIEMLVVLLIIGLLVGLVSAIAQPDQRALLRLEAERLAQLLDLAATEAQLSGKPIAWTSDGTRYQFWRFSEDAGWAELRGNDLLRKRPLPQGMTIAGLWVENLRSQDAMRLEFSPYGATLAYAVEMALGAQHYTVEASPIGELRAMPGQNPNRSGGKING